VRFYFGLGTVLGLPVAVGLERLLEKVTPRRRPAAAGMALAFVASALLLPSYGSLIEADIEARAPSLMQRSALFAFDADRPAAEALDLRSWLKDNIPPSQNIFLSTHPGNHHMSGLYVGTGLRFISAPYNHVFLKHNYVNRYFQDFVRGTRQPQHAWSAPPTFAAGNDRFGELAHFFNVRWWVIDRAGAGVDFGRIAGMTQVHTIGDYAIYRYDVRMSDFLLGSGDLAFDYGRIVIRNARPVSGRLVLKLHWFEDFRVTGATSVGPFPIAGMPLPFVAIMDPGHTVELRF
jgi:hypothetical protein